MKKTRQTTFFLFLLVLCFSSCKKNEVEDILNEVEDILNEVESVTFSAPTIVLTTGETLQLTAIVTATKDPDEFPVSWYSENGDVATVDNNGLVTAIAPGQIKITAKAGGKEGSCNVIVEYFTQAGLNILGNAYATGKSNVFVLYLATREINLSNLTGTGEYLYLEMYTESTIADSLPGNHYSMITDFAAGKTEEYNKFIPNTISPGFTHDGNKWGTWHNILSEDNNVSSVAMNRGTVDISRSGDHYIVAYELYDASNKLFSGIYQGKLPHSFSALKNKRLCQKFFLNTNDTDDTDLHGF